MSPSEPCPSPFRAPNGATGGLSHGARPDICPDLRGWKRLLRRKSRRRNYSSSYPFFPADRPVFHGFHRLRRLWRESQSASSPHFLPAPCLVSSVFLLTSLSPKPLIFGLFPHDRLPLPWDQTAPRTSLGG